MGSQKAITIERIKEIVEATGAKLVSTEYVNNHTPIEFLCSNCGSLWSISWKKYSKGQNQRFLCGSCLKERHKLHLRELKKGYSIEQIRTEFESKGAELISTEYINQKEDIRFKCSACGSPWHIKMTVYNRGDNTDLLCQKCYLKKQGRIKLSYTDVKKFFEDNGSELYSESFDSIDQILKYKCKNCGDQASYRYSTLMQRSGDRRFYCKDCVRGYRLNPNGNYGGENDHHIYDLKWFSYIYKFFNLQKEQEKVYSAHHIKQFSVFPDYRTSFCNGYPIKIKYHDLGSKDPITGKINPFHVVDGYLRASDFPEYAKLVYHNYSEFKFLDLNDKLVTEIIAPVEDMESSYLINRFKYFEQQGLLYIPFFFDELFVDRRLIISCSLVRRVLYRWFPDIYKYTGQSYKVYSLNDLKVELIDVSQAKQFFKENSLSGFIQAECYLSLINNVGDIVVVLSYTYNSGICTIYNCIEKTNTIVSGGISLLLSFINTQYNPREIKYIQDARFPIFNTELEHWGLQLESLSNPNIIYMHKDTNRFFKSMVKSASWLNTKIDIGMELINNTVNNKDYIKVYDMGDMIYGWKKS